MLAGAGGIEPCNNPLPHKDFSIPARPFDSIFDSKAKALVGMTDDEVAYIEAKGWKTSVVPELSIIHQGWLVEWVLISVGSRSRSASQAIDLPNDGGVKLECLFTA